jgi:hypothetical protein
MQFMKQVLPKFTKPLSPDIKENGVKIKETNGIIRNNEPIVAESVIFLRRVCFLRRSISSSEGSHE